MVKYRSLNREFESINGYLTAKSIIDDRCTYANEHGEGIRELAVRAEIFKEGNTSFWVSFTYLDLYDVYFSDSSIKTVGEALELGLIGLAELDRFQIPYVRDPAM